MKKDLFAVYEILFHHFGEQHWWPGETDLEVIVGAILTQSTSWRNVEKAIANLKRKGLMRAEGIRRMRQQDLAELIRPAGYYNAKARKLKEFMNHLYERHGGELDSLLDQPLENLRSELLLIWGIGPETADSIILYAAEKPSFVVDAYTRRIYSRLAYVKDGISYDDLKGFSEKNLPKDVRVYNEFHALLVRLGKEYCRKTKPRCKECPLSKECKRKKARTSSRKR